MKPNTDTLLSLVSFGANIKQTCLLETRTTGEVLRGLADGEWQEPVERVRRLPYKSSEQREAKCELPFVTWSGKFARRTNSGLIQHSGQIGIDVDDLTPKQCLKVISRAVFDPCCLAAFHSASGRGVRLLIRVPTTLDQFTHKVAFRQVVARVRTFYRVEPDLSGSDVARPCFVSFDKGMFINLSAEVLPVRLLLPCPPRQLHKVVPVPAVGPRLEVPKPKPEEEADPAKHNASRRLGRDCAPWRRKSDGTTYFTNWMLLKLARRLATAQAKGRIPDNDEDGMLDAAFGGWAAEVKLHRQPLRQELAKYRGELQKLYYHEKKQPKLKELATLWTRWRQHPNFPRDGTNRERLLFAIRQHCADTGKVKFYLACRDACDVVGAKSSRTGAKLLFELHQARIISRVGGPHGLRQANTYQLIADP